MLACLVRGGTEAVTSEAVRPTCGWRLSSRVRFLQMFALRLTVAGLEGKKRGKAEPASAFSKSELGFLHRAPKSSGGDDISSQPRFPLKKTRAERHTQTTATTHICVARLRGRGRRHLILVSLAALSRRPSRRCPRRRCRSPRRRGGWSSRSPASHRGSPARGPPRTFGARHLVRVRV